MVSLFFCTFCALPQWNLRYFILLCCIDALWASQNGTTAEDQGLCVLTSLFVLKVHRSTCSIHQIHTRFSLRSLTPVFKGTGPVPLLSSCAAAEMNVWTQWAVKSALSLLRCAWPPNISLENSTGSAFNNNIPSAGYQYELLQWQIYNLLAGYYSDSPSVMCKWKLCICLNVLFFFPVFYPLSLLSSLFLSLSLSVSVVLLYST